MTCIRLHVTAEGQTEQAFVRDILTPHLATFNVFADARAILTSKDKRAHKQHRGGLISYQKARADIVAWLKQDDHAECRFTTMFDLYALPEDFPGFADAARNTDPYQRVSIIESALFQDINDRRFIPYIQLHEFEALILADPQRLDWEYLEHDRPIGNLLHMVGAQNPELINDGPQTAPSKRILKEIPEYDKVTAGVSVAQRIGIPAMRSKCGHFAEWLHKLEQEGCVA